MKNRVTNRPLAQHRPLQLRLALRLAVCACFGLLLAVAVAARADNPAERPAIPNDDIQDHADLGRADSPRPAADLVRDASEKPTAIAAFAAVQPRMKVVDLRARDGYLSEVLTLAAYPYGKIYANNDPDSLAGADAEAWSARLQKPELADVARLDLPLAAPLPPYARGLDVVISAGAYADAIRRNLDRQAMNTAVMEALHPAGLYVITDARADDAATVDDAATLCRTLEKQVRKEVEAAGFRFVEASQVLTQAGDKRASSACQPSQRQPLDRFLLKFEKPVADPAAPQAPSTPK